MLNGHGEILPAVTRTGVLDPAERVGMALAAGSVLIGLAALCGWAFHLPMLESVRTGLPTMKANTAVCFAVAGTGLLVLRAGPGASIWRAAFAMVCGAFIAATGASTIIEACAGWSFGIDQILFADPATSPYLHPGRMAPATAAGLGCSGVSVMFIAAALCRPGVTNRAKSCARWGHRLAFVPLAIAYLGVAGYCYDLAGLFKFGPFETVAINTAITFALLGASIILTIPDMGWRRPLLDAPISQSLVSRLVPIALIVPFATGGLLVVGAMAKLYDPLFGLALFAPAAAITGIWKMRVATGAVRKAEIRLRTTTNALQATTDLLHISQRSSQVGSWEWDIRTNDLRWSPEQYRLSGFNPDVMKTVTYADWQASLHPDDRAKAHDMALAVLAGDIPAYEMEFRIVQPWSVGGRVRWVLARAELFRADDGTPLRMVGVNIDVTGRRQAEATLRERENQLRLLADHAPAAIAMFDTDMRYLAASSRYVRDYGLTLDHKGLIGRSHYDLFPDMPQHWRSIHQRVLAGETVSADEDEFPRDSGGVDWVRWQMLPWLANDGSVGGAILFSEVVTQAVQARRALAESEALLRAVFEAAPIGIMIVEAASGRQIYSNPARERIFRRPLHSPQVLADYDEWESYHADGRRVQAGEYPIVKVLNTGKPSSAEFHYQCGDGVRRWIAISSEPVIDDTGKMIAAVGIAKDVDVARRAQAVMARSAADLDALVLARSQELEDSRKHVAHLQRMEALGQLAGGIAHDFNNVLQAVQGGLALIERRLDDKESVRRLAGLVTESAARGTAITGRLLAFSRRSELQSEAIAPLALLTGIRDILTHTLGVGIDVRIDVADGLPAFMADKGQLETVIINLATNARDAMAGAGLLTLAAFGDTPSHPALGKAVTLQPGCYVRLSVTDTGSGMTADVLEKVTEPFFTTKEPGQGTGLGLAMARGFAEQSGGALFIESTPGQGTCVHLWLPVASAPDLARSEPARRAQNLQSSARLLVVDDDPMVRTILTEQLEDRGYFVLTAADGASALAYAENNEPFDLVITDMSMPGMNGLMLNEHLQRLRPKLPSIVLTGHAHEPANADAADGRTPGPMMLSKPVKITSLVERIELLLESAVPATQTGQAPKSSGGESEIW